MIACTCQHVFVPTAATFHGSQFFPALATGAPVWLYTVLHRCPGCLTLRSIVMFDATGAEEAELEAADLLSDVEPLFSSERDSREAAA